MKLTDSTATVKMVLLGQSGSGKSSCLIPLAIPEIVKGWPGLKLRVLDFDGKFAEVAKLQLQARLEGKSALGSTLTSITQAQYDGALENIDYEVCRETTKIQRLGNQTRFVVSGGAQAYQTATRKLATWLKSDLDSDTVLVIDSFTHMATGAIANWSMDLNSRLNQPMGWKDYLPAQQEVQRVLTGLADLPCNIIICAHQGPLDVKKKTGVFIDKPDGTKEAVEEVVDSLMLPLSIGSAGRITVPSQLNHMLVITDSSADRIISTQPKGGVITKTPYFALAKSTYTIDRGMVEYFSLGR